MNKSPAHDEFEPAAEAAREWAERNFRTVLLGLDWLRNALGDYVECLRTDRPAPRGETDSTVMTDLDADWLLRNPPTDYRISPETYAARQAYTDAREIMRDKGTPAAIDQLSLIFALSQFEEDVVLMTVAPFVDAAFPALFGYAHDRLAKDRPTPHLVTSLLASREADAMRFVRDHLSAHAPLRRYNLIHGADENLAALTTLETDEALADFITGRTGHDERVRHLLRPVQVGACPASILPSTDRFLDQLRSEQATAAMIIGPKRSGRRSVAARIAAEMGHGLCELQIRHLPPAGPQRTSALRLITRESALQGTAVLVDLTSLHEQAAAPGGGDETAVAEEILADLSARMFFVSDRRPDLPGHVPVLRTASLDEAERSALWQAALPQIGKVSDTSAAVLAQHFQLGPSEIALICAEVAGTHDGPGVWRTCRDAASRGLDAMAEHIEPRFGWNDIVLPDDISGDLKAISAQVTHRASVYQDGGFARKLVRGRGVSAMFAGPSGVGKTMAAEVIAHDLDLNLYRIDLSQVISKYIGETEQNLRRVFDAAEAGGAVLFFDEADALFGKRSEVKDSHDRYANIEISYLLQRMETYSGLAILATNLKSHIDTAFLRRLRFVIDLPFPDASQREKIWARAFPKETRTGDLDFKALGRLEVAGGNIVVIAVNAAFLAAADGAPVSMDHIARSARAEMRKLDKEFRPSWSVGGNS